MYWRAAGRSLRLAACTLLFMLATTAAFAHASLVASDPADGSVLAAPPPELTLSFNEQVAPLVIRLIAANGAASDITGVRQEGTRLILTPPPLGRGSHTLSWRVMSADGHPVGGALVFSIGARSKATAARDQADGPRRVAIWAIRCLVYIGLFAGVGGAFVLTWLSPEGAASGARMLSLVAIGLGLAATALSVGVQGLDELAAPLSALAHPETWRAGLRGSFGIAAAITALALAGGAVSLLWRPGVPSRAVALTAYVAAGLALASSGHAANASPQWLTRPAIFLHGIGLAFWIGALAPLGLALPSSQPQGLVLLKRFSRLAPMPVALLLIAGVTLAAIQLARLDALWTTSYGRVLIAKLALVGLLLALAGWNRWGLTKPVLAADAAAMRRLRRSIAAELLLVIAILGVTGLWRFTPPPRSLATADQSFFTHLHAEKAMANITIAPAHAGVVGIAIQLETPDERPLAAREVTVSLANPDAGIEPLRKQAKLAADGQWKVEMTAAVSGRWTLGLDILISDFERTRVEAPVLIQ